MVALLACINLFLAFRSLRCQNCTVVLLLTCMLINALCVCVAAIYQLNKTPLPYVMAAHQAANTLCLLICAMTYILVAFNARLLVDAGVYFANKARLENAAGVRCKVWFASGIVAVMVIAVTFCFFKVAKYGGPSPWKAIGVWTLPVLRTIFILAWGLSLVSLYRIVQKTGKLKPKKHLFRFHCTMLTLYLIVGGLAAYA